MSSTRAANREQFGLNRRGQVTETFRNGIEQLGYHNMVDVSGGPVYSWKLSPRSPSTFNWPVMQVLTALLGEHDADMAPIHARRQW